MIKVKATVQQYTVPALTNLNLSQPDFWSTFHHKIHDSVQCYQTFDYL